jgi:hypothetical protein
VTGALAGWSIYAGIGLLALWVDAPRRAQRFLLLSMVGLLALLALEAIFGLIQPINALQGIGTAPIGTIIWYSYLAKSKRVQATYGTNGRTPSAGARAVGAGVALAVVSVMCLGIAAGFHDPEEAQWQEFRSAAGGFRVQAPGHPMEQSFPGDPATETPPTKSISFQRGRQEFAVAYFDLGQAEFEVEAALQRVQTNLLGAFNATLVDTRSTVWRTHPMRQFGATGPDHSTRIEARIYSVGLRIFSTMASSPSGTPTAAARRFLDSFDVDESRPLDPR